MQRARQYPRQEEPTGISIAQADAQHANFIQKRLKELQDKKKTSNAPCTSSAVSPPKKECNLNNAPTPSTSVTTSVVKTEPAVPIIPFKNDGSFLEQFKKLQAEGKLQIKIQKPEQKSLELTEAQKQLNEDDPGENTGPKIKPEVKSAIERLAITIAINGDHEEEAAKTTNEGNEHYMFLYNTSGEEYQFFRERVEALKAAKIRAQESGALPSSRDSETSQGDESSQGADGPSERKRKRKSRWGPETEMANVPAPGLMSTIPVFAQRDLGLQAYAVQVFGSTDLSPQQWKQLDDQRKMRALYEMMQNKQRQAEAMARAGKVKYEYDSDEETDGGTWEHKKRAEEMEKTKIVAKELTEKARGKHHIGDFLPPDELERFMAKYEAVKSGDTADFSDYVEHKLNESNVGFQMLQKMGWSEGQGLGADGSGITQPVNKSAPAAEKAGVGINKPHDLTEDDDEFEAYRKRMMLAYRFRPNPLNNPRRAYY